MRETTRDFPRNRGYPWGRLSSVLRRNIQIERLQWLRTSRFDLVCFISLNDDEIACCEVDHLTFNHRTTFAGDDVEPLVAARVLVLRTARRVTRREGHHRGLGVVGFHNDIEPAIGAGLRALHAIPPVGRYIENRCDRVR